ncbi:MAG: hypothetical protein ACN2B6_12425 [Rickettsiales bacterium]
MSKRFGRNQKRKLKNEIQELKGDVQKHRVRADRNESLVWRARYIIETLNRVNPDSAIFDPVRSISSGANRIHPYRKPRFYSADSGTKPVCDHMLKTINLNNLEVEIENSDLADAVHFYVKVGDRVGYALSNEALRIMPIEILAKMVSEQISAELKRIAANRR